VPFSFPRDLANATTLLSKTALAPHCLPLLRRRVPV